MSKANIEKMLEKLENELATSENSFADTVQNVGSLFTDILEKSFVVLATRKQSERLVDTLAKIRSLPAPYNSFFEKQFEQALTIFSSEWTSKEWPDIKESDGICFAKTATVQKAFLLEKGGYAFSKKDVKQAKITCEVLLCTDYNTFSSLWEKRKDNFQKDFQENMERALEYEAKPRERQYINDKDKFFKRLDRIVKVLLVSDIKKDIVDLYRKYGMTPPEID